MLTDCLGIWEEIFPLSERRTRNFLHSFQWIICEPLIKARFLKFWNPLCMWVTCQTLIKLESMETVTVKVVFLICAFLRDPCWEMAASVTSFHKWGNEQRLEIYTSSSGAKQRFKPKLLKWKPARPTCSAPRLSFPHWCSKGIPSWEVCRRPEVSPWPPRCPPSASKLK